MTIEDIVKSPEYPAFQAEILRLLAKNRLANGTILIVAVVLAAGAVFGGVKDEVHGYTPKGYVQPKEPEVLERLEWFKDQKLALMMCLGLYSNIGIKESWPLCDSKADANADVFRILRQAERR